MRTWRSVRPRNPSSLPLKLHKDPNRGSFAVLDCAQQYTGVRLCHNPTPLGLNWSAGIASVIPIDAYATNPVELHRSPKGREMRRPVSWAVCVNSLQKLGPEVAEGFVPVVEPNAAGDIAPQRVYSHERTA
jgi:hypothetical protein